MLYVTLQVFMTFMFSASILFFIYLEFAIRYMKKKTSKMFANNRNAMQGYDNPVLDMSGENTTAIKYMERDNSILKNVPIFNAEEGASLFMRSGLVGKHQ